MTMEALRKYVIDAERAFEQREWLEGRDILHQALEIEPVYAVAHNHLGWLYVYHLIDYNLAEMHLKLALKYAPGYHAPYLHMAQLLFDAGRLDELMVLLDKASKVTGVSKSFIYNDLARVYEVKGQYRKAVNQYKLAARWAFDEHEMLTIKKNIKRCRQKKWMFFW